MRVLVTGAAGLIGRPTVRMLAQEGHELLATDLHATRMRLAQMDDPTPGVRWRRLDVRQREQVRALLAELRPEAVVHLAARHFIPWCDRYPAATLRTNALGTQNLLDVMRGLSGESRLVFASSAAVYGPSTARLAEDAPLGPDDIYGASKVTGEQLVELALRREVEMKAIVLRLFNAIGPGDPHPHLIPRLVSELGRGGRRVRVGNLESVRDYIHVEDVARAVCAALTADLPSLTRVNVGTGNGRSVGEVIDALGTLTGRPLEVVSLAARRRAVDRPFLVADPTLARRVLGWEPEVSFEAALARTLRSVGIATSMDPAGPSSVAGPASVAEPSSVAEPLAVAESPVLAERPAMAEPLAVA